MSLLSRLLQDVPPPNAAIELAPDHVSAIVADRHGRDVTIASRAREPLARGALTPGLGAPNIRDRAAVAQALERVLERVGRPRRVGLVIPDQAAKVSIVRLEKVPARTDDLEQLMRWQMKKAVPFAIDEAQLTYAPGVASADGHDFVVAAMRRDVLDEYESVCVSAGVQPGVVDLATFNAANAVLASAAPPKGDWLLVRASGDDASLVIMLGQHLAFFRSHGGEAGETLVDLIHQTAMYYEDRLKGPGFERVVLAGLNDRAGEAEAARRSVSSRISARVEMLDDAAPLFGLLTREKAVA